MFNYQFFFLLEELKKQSKCLDKQVSCIITDTEHNILSVGVNKVRTCGGCTKHGNKDACCVEHAEAVAISNLKLSNIHGKQLKAYVSLYPCEECQRLLEGVVSEVYVYGDKHKDKVVNLPIMALPNLSLKLPELNGTDKQLAVVQGELGELITSISNFFYRVHERDEGLDELLDEVVDAKTQISVMLAMLQANYSSSVYADLGEMEERKLMKVKGAIDSGRIKRGSPNHNSLS